MPADRWGRPDQPSADTALLRPAAMLVVTTPPTQAGRSVAVGPEGVVLGRDRACDLALSSEHVSRRHAAVRAGAGGYLIEDLGSSNGTWRNDEPVVAPSPLRDGDRLRLADVEIEFRLTVPWDPPPRRSEPATGEPWTPDQPTQLAPVSRQSLRQELREAPGFSVSALLLAIAGSVVGAMLSGAAGTGPWGSLAAAAIGPVVSSAFSTKRAGEKGRVRRAAIIILSATALAVTWAGISLAERATGKPVLPGTAERVYTFPGSAVMGRGGGTTASSLTVTDGLAVTATNSVDCGTIAVGATVHCAPAVEVRSTGTERLHITGVDVTGDGGDFSADDSCAGRWLNTGETCEMTVAFTPSQAGKRTATLVIHQNLPAPDTGTPVALSGTGEGEAPLQDSCVDGYVWREAVSGDLVCVTPQTRAQAQQDNALAESRRSPDGGPYGAETCLDGYVWREAVPGDLVCVTPETRAQTQEDNALAESRRAG